jgi:hypothetical protein
MPTSPSSTSPTTGASSSTADEAKRAAADAADQAKDKAADLTGQAKSAAADEASKRKGQAAGVLSDVAGALHETGDALRDRDRDAFAQYAEMAASQVESLTDQLRDRNVGELLDEAERFARRDPGLFIGGAFLLGILGGRFLKASAPSSRRSGATYGGSYTARGADPYRARPATDYAAYGTPAYGGTAPGTAAPAAGATSPTAATSTDTPL